MWDVISKRMSRAVAISEIDAKNRPILPNPLILSLSKDGLPRYVSRMAFYVYLLRCRDGSYYAGHTDDLELRFAQHQSGVFEGYTSTRRPVALAWCEMFATRDEAFAAERKIKGWSRAKKEALIAGDWERVSALARNRQVAAKT